MKKAIIYVLLAILFSLQACHPDEEEWADAEITEFDVEPAATSAFFTAKVNFPGDKEMVLELSEKQDLSDAKRYTMIQESDLAFSVRVDGLKSVSDYYYCLIVQNSTISLATGIEGFTTRADAPIVATESINDITYSSVRLEGIVLEDGGAAIIECGMSWSREPHPTIEDNIVKCGSGLGSFTAVIQGLKSNTLYYVRAYAVNSMGVSYGNELTFYTLPQPLPVGAVNGLFSVSEDRQVWFSQGNLQYQASSGIWRFADCQWDFVGGTETNGYSAGTVSGSTNNDVSATYAGWIDMFGWGTSGYYHGAVCFQPWSVKTNDANYFAYGNSECNLNDMSGKADWGYNSISNGGGQENFWRTLTQKEWDYVLKNRSTDSGIRYAKAEVGGVTGVILLPDLWDAAVYPLNGANQNDAPFDVNVLDVSSWSILETNGAVFLPITGSRSFGSDNVLFIYGLSRGSYWTATKYNYTSSTGNEFYNAYYLNFDENSLYITDFSRYRGHSVRLVRDY